MIINRWANTSRTTFDAEENFLFRSNVQWIHLEMSCLGPKPIKADIIKCDIRRFSSAQEFQMGNFQKYWSQNVGQDFLALDFFHGRNILKVDGRDPQNREKNAPAGRFTCMCLMVMHPHTKYHWPISKQKCYSPDKKILFKKQLFDLEVKGGVLHTIMTFMGPWPLTSRSNNCFLNSIFLSGP
jgi:hypothetical protein